MEAPGDQAEPTASPDCLPPPASLGREVQTPQVRTLPVGPAGFTAQPSCPLSRHQQDAQFCRRHLLGPGQQRPMGAALLSTVRPGWGGGR